MQYVPTTLHDSPEFVQSEIAKFASFQPKPQRFQLDIIDGLFVDNLTVEPGIVHSLDMHGLSLDLHFMVVEPLEWLREIQDCPAIDMVIAQVERMTSLEAYVDEVKNELGYRPGLALDLYTPFTAIPKKLLPELAVVQIMGNQAGFQGQSLHPTAVLAVREAAHVKMMNGYDYEISVDINMNHETIPRVADAGATMVAIGSYLTGEQATENWKNLQSLV